jgi:hypothetical protein
VTLGLIARKVPATCSSPQYSSDRRPFATLLPRLSEPIAVVAIHRCLALVLFAMFAIGWMLATGRVDGCAREPRLAGSLGIGLVRSGPSPEGKARFLM